jgi:alcohol dehydrogenase (cytochrome c)
MAMVPVAKGGYLSAGVNVQTAIRPGSDGRYGLLRALDMQTGKVLWTARQRTEFTSGILATAGGLAFTGSQERQFKAYDQKTGKLLWQSGVSETPNGAPISYAVDGKQYIALITGHGSPLTLGEGDLVPEVGNPPVNGGAIYVFALPQ